VNRYVPGFNQSDFSPDRSKLAHTQAKLLGCLSDDVIERRQVSRWNAATPPKAATLGLGF
jgi:hypothetical protein